MGRSQETFHKKEVRQKKEKKRNEKAQKRLARKGKSKSTGLDDMIAYVDERGIITSTPPDPGKKQRIEADGIEISIPKQSLNSESGSIRKGKVTFFNEAKGYGFIKDSETQEKVFVHVNEAGEEFKEGSTVSYIRMRGRKGPTAEKVKLIR
jgi:cold shock CspA family protein